MSPDYPADKLAATERLWEDLGRGEGPGLLARQPNADGFDVKSKLTLKILVLK
jgi:hypothetical protein